MPIPVVCPSCKARFSVSDKFAGKKGPCPKCKTVITVPAAAPEEVKIHVPEVFASAGKDTKGRPVSKPLARPETRVKPALIAGIAGAALLVVIIAFALRGVSNKVPLVAVGLLVVSPPLVLGGYTFLRDDDKLDPYVGRELWTRVLICSAGYALLWAAYMPLSSYITGEMWQWMFIAPVFISIGGGIALACFDLDFGAGSLHYSFYVLVTLLLRAALGIAPIWTPVTSGM